MAGWGWRPPRQGRTALYRLYGSDGELLYIGVSNDPPVRYRQHQKVQPWGGEIASRTIEWFDTRHEALHAEPAAIRAESPRYNVVYSTPGSVPVAQRADEPCRQEGIASPDLAAATVELLGVKAEYRADLVRALEARDDAIRRIATKRDLKQVDIVRITGYTRETVRQALNPEIWVAVRKAAEERRAAIAAAKQADAPDVAGLISHARDNNRAALDRLED